MEFSLSRRWRLHAAAHPGHDVLMALTLKGALLLAIYALFFGPAHHVPSDAGATANALVGARASKDNP